MDYCEFYSNSKLCNLIKSDCNNNTIGHAYILCGQDELLLSYFAKQVAKQILTNHSENCECAVCANINKNIYSDVLTYPKENKQSLLVEDVNEIVNASYVYPLVGNRKIFILNNAELCTVQAQNKLLKTLEEPNGYVTFILTTTVPSAVLATIRSRAKLIDINSLLFCDIEKFLIKNSNLKSTEIAPYVNSSNGTITKALKLVNDPDFLKIKKLALDVFVSMTSSSDVLTFSHAILSYKNRTAEILDELLINVSDLTLVNSGLTDFVTNKEILQAYDKINYSTKALSLIQKEILNAQHKMASNCNPNAVVDGLLLKMLEVKHKWK